MMSEDAVDKSRSLAFIPVVILLFIGGIQIYLAKTTNLTPWKGGGFGMFSTTDGAANRSLRVTEWDRIIQRSSYWKENWKTSLHARSCFLVIGNSRTLQRES
jgi:hypothetical protein